MGVARESPTIDELSAYLAEISGDLPYIVGGDFNSHFEPLPGLLDGFPSEEETRWLVPPVEAPPPKAWTPVALQITALTLKFGIRACNGRTNSDAPSRTTYNRVGRESRLDYVLVQMVNWPTIKDFRVTERSDSDHNALELDLIHPGLPTPATTNEGNKPDLLLANNRRRIRWENIASSREKLPKLYAGVIPILERVGELDCGVGNKEALGKLHQAHEDLIKGAAPILFSNAQNSKRGEAQKSSWYNKACKKAKEELLKNIKEGQGGEKVRESRRVYKKLLVHAKKEWEENQWEEINNSLVKGDHRMFWRVVNGGSGNLHSAIEPNIAPGVWQIHFQSLYSSELGETPNDVGGDQAVYEGEPITVGEVRAAIAGLTSGKAPGLDGLPGDLFKQEPDVWAPYLAVLFNGVLSGMEVPTNYRPISLIDVPQKLLGRVLLNRLQEWEEETGVLSPYQAGFRKEVSTVDQVFRLNMIYWRAAIFDGGSLYTIFVDLRAAFDLVPRGKLWSVLSEMGVPADILLILRRLHHNNYARVRCGKSGALMDRFPVDRGVRQGCVLAPTLFCLFVNGVIAHLNGTENTDAPKLNGSRVPAIMFADDTLLLSKTPMGIQRILDSFVAFCTDRGLEINATKTKFMVLNPSQKLRPNPLLGASRLERVSTFEYLGVTLNQTMSWGPHQTRANLKLVQSTGGIVRLMKSSTYRPLGPLIQIYKAQARGATMYGAELWGHTPTRSLSVTENNFIRQIVALPPSTPLLPVGDGERTQQPEETLGLGRMGSEDQTTGIRWRISVGSRIAEGSGGAGYADPGSGETECNMRLQEAFTVPITIGPVF
ncbi:uncharacterized protein LOC144784041 [Lissotriton helveticus]